MNGQIIQENNKDELRSADYAVKVDQHEIEIIEVKKRLSNLEEKFGTNEAIADTLCKAEDKANDIKKFFIAGISKALKEETIKESIKVLIEAVDRSAVKKIIKRFATIVGWVISLIIAAIIGKYFGR